MTPEQIEEAALEAGFRAARDVFDKLNWTDIGWAEIEDAIRAFDAAKEAAMWMPIEEAPRDGTPVYVRHVAGFNIEAIWRDQFHEWLTVLGAWVPDEKLTHFRPLPKPPAQQVKP